MARHRAVVLTVAVALVTAASSIAQEGRWIVRARGLAVLPDDDGDLIAGTQARLAAGSTAGGELSIAFLLSPSWDVEVAAAAFPLDLTSEGDPSIAVGALTTAMGSLSLHYRFASRSRFKPYLGLGVSLATFSGFEPTQELKDAGIATLELANSVRLGSQAGVDFVLGKGWIASLAVSYVPATSRVDLVLPSGAIFDTVALELNPLVVALGFGHRF